MPVARPILVSGRLFASVRAAAKVIRGTAAGISLALSRADGKPATYRGYTVEWATMPTCEAGGEACGGAVDNPMDNGGGR
jgi:hypothetical protein